MKRIVLLVFAAVTSFTIVTCKLLEMPPNAPVFLVVKSVGTHSVTIAWEDTAFNEDGFEIYRRSDDEQDFTLVVDTEADQTEFEDSPLRSDTAYEYFVCAFRLNAQDSKIISDNSNTVVATTEKELSIPAAPDNLTAENVTASSVSLTWNDNSDSEDGFVIQQKIVGVESFKKIATTEPSQSGYECTGLSEDTLYRYRIRSYNSAGTSEWSSVLEVRTIKNPGVTVDPVSGLVTSEAGLSATFSVVLDSQPTANVTIPLSSGDSTEGSISSSSLIFTTSNWDTPVTVTVFGEDDEFADGDKIYYVVTGTITSNDSDYDGMNPEDVQVLNWDNELAGIRVNPTAGLVTSESGGSAIFTVVLNTEPSADVVIGIASNDPGEGGASPLSLTFTSTDWFTPQPVTVTGVDDDIDDGSQIYTIQTNAAVSADSEYNGLDASDVLVTNTDDDTAGITVDTADGVTTSELATSDTFTVVLDSEPTADVTMTVASSELTEGTVAPSSLTFTAADWNAAQPVTVTGVDDDIDDGDRSFTVLVNAATSADPKYDGLDAADVTVINTNNDTAGITVNPTSGLITGEDGTAASFTVVLDTRPTGNVTITLSSNTPTEGTVSPTTLAFTPTNWDIAKTVTVTGVNDNALDGNQLYTIVTAPAVSNDGAYNGLDAADVQVSNTDDDEGEVIVFPTSGLVTSEAGGTATFTVVLNAAPSADVSVSLICLDPTEGSVNPLSLTFTSSDWNLPQTVTVTGEDDAETDGPILYTIFFYDAESTDPNFDSKNVASVSVTNTDNDIPGFTVNPTDGLITTESGESATFDVVLNMAPSFDVTTAISSGDLGEGTVNPTSLTFGITDWDTPQTVTVTGENDDIDDGSQTYSIDLAPATSTDGNYDGLDPEDVSVINTDDDVSGIIVTPTSGLATDEAETTDTFTVVLNSEPTADINIDLSSSDSSEASVSPASLTFTALNWDIAQTVTVTGVNDDVDDDPQSYTIMVEPASTADATYNGLDASDVTGSNGDDDTVGIVVDPTIGLITDEFGVSDTFTIVLETEPIANVSIGVSSSDDGEGSVSPGTLTFTSSNWSLPQTVTVTGINDYIDDESQSYTVITAAASSSDAKYNGINPADVSVVNNDDGDTAGIAVTPTTGLTTSEDGGFDTFTVVLESEPVASVEIGISSSNPGEGDVDKTTLTFTSLNWNIEQTVTVTGVDDGVIADGAQLYTIQLAAAVSADSNYSGYNPSDVEVTNVDNDEAGITVAPTSGLVTTESGDSDTFTVVLNTQPIDQVSIGLSSSDPSEGTVTPTNLTFTVANWDEPQTVTVTGVEDGGALDGDQAYTVETDAAVSDDPAYAGINPADVLVTNEDNDVLGEWDTTKWDGSTWGP